MKQLFTYIAGYRGSRADSSNSWKLTRKLKWWKQESRLCCKLLCHILATSNQTTEYLFI